MTPLNEIWAITHDDSSRITLRHLGLRERRGGGAVSGMLVQILVKEGETAAVNTGYPHDRRGCFGKHWVGYECPKR